MGISLGAWISILLGGAFTVAASWLVVYAGRRDRAQDREKQNYEDLEDQVDENTEDIAHMSGWLEAKHDYKPREH